MIIYDTKKEAQENKRSDETIAKVCGGWAVMTYDEYYVWKKQA